MEKIGYLTAHLRDRPTAFERIRYDYNPKTAGLVWMKIANELIGDFEKTKDLLNCWRALIGYAFGFKTKGIGIDLNLNASIGLMGMTGSGKTKTMEIFNEFCKIDNIQYMNNGISKKMEFPMFHAKNIAGEYAQNGYNTIFHYSHFYNLCIDDLGSEMEETAHFANKANVIASIIEERHDNNLFTHFTTNLDEEEIKQKYGDRVYSRIKEDCNLITVNDKDFRIKD